MKLQHNPAALTSPGQAISERARWEHSLVKYVDTFLMKYLDTVTEEVLATREANPHFFSELYESTVTSIVDGLDADPETLVVVDEILRDTQFPSEVYDTAQYLLTETVDMGLSEEDLRNLLTAGLDYDEPSITDDPTLLASAVPRMIGQVLARSTGRGRKWRSSAQANTRRAATGALNEVQNRVMQRTELTHKQWITRRDDRVRPTHAEADGQIVPKASLFQVGAASLAYPGQGSYPPEEIYGCRCVMIAVNPDGSLR